MVQPVMNRFWRVNLLLALLGCAVVQAQPQPVSPHVVPPPPTPGHAQPHLVTPRAVPIPTQTIDAFLKWDGETKQATVVHGTAEAKFSFSLTNVSQEVVTINGVHTSCGCTAAQLPAVPWRIEPGASGQIGATMNLANKSGTITKTVTVNTDKGPKLLFVKANILPPSAEQMEMDSRENNQRIALADRQAVFRGDCARCHSESKDKMGHELYTSVCGVCHEAEHRAAMVPNLHALKSPTNADYWRNWVTHGKAGTLMPAFSEKEGGILTDEQIDSLVKYLSETIPSKTASQPAGSDAPGTAQKSL
jgi:cytochrome c553